MFEAKLTIEAPGLTTAINRLADAIAYSCAPATVPSSNPANHTQARFAAPAPTGVPTAPMGALAYQNGVPASSYPSNALTSQQTGVPVAQAPQYTIDQVMKAGVALVETGRMDDLKNLLQSFGINAVSELKPEQTGAFATALRGLGAKI